MRYMKEVPTVTMKDINDNEIKDENGDPVEITFKGFILQRLVDSQFAANMDMIMSAFQIKTALNGHKSGQIALETTDWEKLVEAVRNPAAGSQYHPLLAINLVPFMREIVDATEEPTNGKAKKKVSSKN